MRAVVMKFGGSSVVDATAMKRVIRIVSAAREAGNVPVVVVSALGGVTDRLLGLTETARKGHAGGVDAPVRELLERHLAEAKALGAAEDATLAPALESQFPPAGALPRAMGDCRGADPRALDAVAASG